MTRILSKRLCLSLILPILLSGCASSGFRSSVAEFGILTEATAAAQRSSLQIIIEDEQERIAAALAKDRVELVLARPDCLPPSAMGKPPCTVARRDRKPLETAASFSHILALGSSLEDYAANLVLLSSDASRDKEDFKNALAGAANSLASLDTAVRKAAKVESKPNVEQRLGGAAAIAASIGNLYFEHRRAKALKSIITKADPVVQEAAGLLQHAYSMDQLYKQAGLLRGVQAAQVEVRRVAANRATTDGEMRRVQQNLFLLVDEFNEAAKGADRFDAVGHAHAELAKAAQNGASKEDLLLVAQSLFALAQTVGEELPKLKD